MEIEDRDDPPSGRIHECDACGRKGVWGPGWAWYGSYQQIENDEPIFKACSEECMSQRKKIEAERRNSSRLAFLERRRGEAVRTLETIDSEIAKLKEGKAE